MAKKIIESPSAYILRKQTKTHLPRHILFKIWGGGEREKENLEWNEGEKKETLYTKNNTEIVLNILTRNDTSQKKIDLHHYTTGRKKKKQGKQNCT